MLLCSSLGIAESKEGELHTDKAINVTIENVIDCAGAASHEESTQEEFQEVSGIGPR